MLEARKEAEPDPEIISPTEAKKECNSCEEVFTFQYQFLKYSKAKHPKTVPECKTIKEGKCALLGIVMVLTTKIQDHQTLCHHTVELLLEDLYKNVFFLNQAYELQFGVHLRNTKKKTHTNRRHDRTCFDRVMVSGALQKPLNQTSRPHRAVSQCKSLSHLLPYML